MSEAPKVIEVSYAWSGALSKREGTGFITLHHAAAKNASPQDIHRWHLDNGWVGFGYHYYVRKDGSIYRGRPEGTVGAHAPGFNFNSVGICFEGNFETEEMGETQLRSGQSLVKMLLERHPGALVKGHRELNATACPGAKFPLSSFKNMSDGGVSVEVIKLNLDIDGENKTVEAVYQDGANYVKLRDIVNALGFTSAEIKWNGETGGIAIRRG